MKISATHFHDHHHPHAKTSNNNLLCPPPLKINKDSHVITKSSSSPPSSSSMSSLGLAGPAKPPQRHPVIIYTHSPKIIHTHPKDFMALVQKLTGLSQSDDNHTPRVKHEKGNRVAEDDNKNLKTVGIGNDDNESSSVITDENCGSIGEGQGNSCFMPPIFEPNNPFVANIPVFTANSADFLCTNQPFYNYTNSLFFPPPPTISSSSSLEAMNEFRDY